MNVTKEAYGKTKDGTAVEAYVLVNSHGLKAKILTYGATLIGLEAPDRQGKAENVVLDLTSLDEYLAGHPYMGSIAGRYANRIAKGKFTLDGKQYALATNNGPNHLHGGNVGFDKAVWKAVELRGRGTVGVQMTHVSPDGDEGYPGKLTATVCYVLDDQNQLTIDLSAVTDKPTIVNLCNHAYWNLGGPTCPDILGHELVLPADRYVPVDDTLIPLGELRPVKDGPMDFTAPKLIGARIGEVSGGYDHCWVLNRACPGMTLAARLSDPKTGRRMEIFTTQPGIQFYTGNFLDMTRADGVKYPKHKALCLETEHYPDSPNRPEWPSVVLRPGETYRETTIHRFSTTPPPRGG